jgi:plastocyanin
VLPAAAGSEPVPNIEAHNGGSPYPYSWVASPSPVVIAPGGSVAIANPTGVPHGVEWIGPPSTPGCGGTVPVGAGHFGTNWSGTCTFTKPGTYTFYCTVHGAAMSGTITVEAAGTTTATTPTTSTSTETTGATSSTQSPPPQSGGPAPTGPPGPGAGALTTPFSGIRPLALAAAAHGDTVRGSVAISHAGAGGRLVVEALAARASLAEARAAAGRVLVGRFARAGLPAGTVHFVLHLYRRAQRALRAHGRLALLITATVTEPGGAARTVSSRITLHR